MPMPIPATIILRTSSMLVLSPLMRLPSRVPSRRTDIGSSPMPSVAQAKLIKGSR